MSGRIKKIFVEPGGEIAKGQALVVIEPQSNERKITTQYSPVKGVVADIPTRIGETTAGGLTDPPLMIIADMSNIYVEVNVDGPDMSKVAPGQTAKITVDAFYKSPIRGLVIRKDRHPVAPSETPEFRVTIQITQVRRAIRKRLRPGMSATAWIKIRT